MGHSDTARRTSPAAWILIAPIRFYQKFITPYTPATCRYYPTCSEYAVRSLRAHGAFKGCVLTIWRLLRCNPWSHGGVDHTPERGHWHSPRPPAETDVDRANLGDSGTDRGAGAVRDTGVDVPEQGDAGEDVIHVLPHTKTCGDTMTIADQTARPAADAPNAGRTAA